MAMMRVLEPEWPERGSSRLAPRSPPPGFERQRRWGGVPNGLGPNGWSSSTHTASRIHFPGQSVFLQGPYKDSLRSDPSPGYWGRAQDPRVFESDSVRAEALAWRYYTRPQVHALRMGARNSLWLPRYRGVTALVFGHVDFPEGFLRGLSIPGW